MNYESYKFIDKPLLNELIECNNVIFLGDLGSGKSVLLHQYVNELLSSTDKNNVYIHDPKCSEYYHKKDYECLNIITQSDEEKFINALNKIVDQRLKLSKDALSKEPNIIVISDEIGGSYLERFLLEHCQDFPKTNIKLLLASQNFDGHLNKLKNKNWCKFYIEGKYGDKTRKIIAGDQLSLFSL